MKFNKIKFNKIKLSDMKLSNMKYSYLHWKQKINRIWNQNHEDSFISKHQYYQWSPCMYLILLKRYIF